MVGNAVRISVRVAEVVRSCQMSKGARGMKNPLESLHTTLVMGLVITVIMVLLVQAIGA